jgi:rare lipoprotein A
VRPGTSVRILVVFAALLLAACARTMPPPAPTVPHPPAVKGEERGLASWYGYPHHGKRTASGEIYDMNELTCAHRTLPLGTRLLVTNLDNGRSVEVRVNDRGPFVDGRILDLSYAAARMLGAERPGVIRVSIRVIALPGAAMEAPEDGMRPGAFAVQLGAFASRAGAESLRAAVAGQGDPVSVVQAAAGSAVFYRVRVGSYAERGAAHAMAERLAARGYRSVLVTD